MINHFLTRRLSNRLLFMIFGTAVLALTACQSNKPATPTPLAAATALTPTMAATETVTPSNTET
ncbi:MAG: hypothetical protein KC445_04620, partial [Anaerolineales bacterium]|nr:hypothetical protein [Anaerolineales bacterium]